MHVESSPRFRPGRLPRVVRATALRWLLLAVLTGLVAFGATGVAASDQSHPIDPGNHPFRW
jgi:hypothetical protein